MNKEVEQFTVGMDRVFDPRLAKWDILGSAAHAVMLEKTGLLKKSELIPVLNALKSIFEKVEKEGLHLEPGVEDIHSQLEIELTGMTGAAGKKIHTGRSRNDQVLVSLRLFMRNELAIIGKKVKELSDQLLAKAEEHREVLMPGYTHMQIAMLSSFGMWFACWAESLGDDLLHIQTAFRLNNRNPLGSAAGYGTDLPVDRDYTANLLEFDDLNIISSYAQLSRSKTDIASAQALAAVAQTISKLSGEMILFCSQNFSFFRLPAELTTGSSIMPQKKNPDVLEIIRAGCNRLQGIPNEIALMTANLTSGYHRDMQILKEILIPAFDRLRECLDMSSLTIESIEVNRNIFDNEFYNPLFSTNEVNKLVKQGIPFREAYRQVASMASGSRYQTPSLSEFTHQGSIGNLCLNRISERISHITKTIEPPSSEDLAKIFFQTTDIYNQV